MVLVQRDKQVHQLVRRSRIKIGGGLVSKHQRRPRHDGAGDGDTLLLAAGHLCRSTISQPLQANLAQYLFSACLSFRGRHTLHLHHKLDVFPGGQHRYQVVGLEHKAYLAEPEVSQLALGEIVDAAIVDPHFAAVRNIEAADRVQQRRLAAA